MSTQKKKTTAKKSAPTKKAAPKKSSAKKAPAKKAAAAKTPAKKAPAKKAAPVVKIAKTNTTSSSPDLKVTINSESIHEAVDKGVDKATIVINDFVDEIEKAASKIEWALSDDVKKTSLFKRIFGRKK
jgi:hypothetical protein